MKTLQWGILGLDLIAEEFATHLEKHCGSFTAVCTDPIRLKAFAQRHSVKKCYTSYENFLNDPDINIVYISTLGDEHYSNIISCLNHGKHVFCEKTMLGNSHELKAAKELAEKKHLFLGEAMTIFYMPLYTRIREMIQDGAIGTLKMVRADFGSLKEERPDNPLFSTEKKGGAMYDIGIYALSFIFSFMTSFPDQEIHLMNPHPLGVDELWNIVLRNKEGELANLNLALRCKLPKRAIIAGDKAYFIIDSYNRPDSAILVFPDGSVKEIHEGSASDAVSYEILGAEQAILERNYKSSNLNVTEKVVEMMEKLLYTT